MPPVKCVQSAIRVLLQHLKIRNVVLPAIRFQIPENAQSRLFIGKKEPAKITRELLNTRAHGNKIVIRTQVRDFVFRKKFLHSNVRVISRRSCAHVDVRNSQFLRVEIIDVELGSKANSPIHRLETRVAVKQVKRKTEILIQEALLAFAEKFRRS